MNYFHLTADIITIIVMVFLIITNKKASKRLAEDKIKFIEKKKRDKNIDLERQYKSWIDVFAILEKKERESRGGKEEDLIEDAILSLINNFEIYRNDEAI